MEREASGPVNQKAAKAVLGVSFIRRVRKALSRKTLAKTAEERTGSPEDKPQTAHSEDVAADTVVDITEDAPKSPQQLPSDPSSETTIKMIADSTADVSSPAEPAPAVEIQSTKPEREADVEAAAAEADLPSPKSATSTAWSPLRPTSSKSWRVTVMTGLQIDRAARHSPLTPTQPATPATPATVKSDTTDGNTITPASSAGEDSSEFEKRKLEKSQTVNVAAAPERLWHRVSIFRRHTLSARDSDPDRSMPSTARSQARPPLPMQGDNRAAAAQNHTANSPVFAPTPRAAEAKNLPGGDEPGAAATPLALGLKQEEICNYDYCL